MKMSIYLFETCTIFSLFYKDVVIKHNKDGMEKNIMIQKIAQYITILKTCNIKISNN